MWCWRRLLRVPWTARRTNQSVLKEISPGFSLEGLMLKLKLQYFSHLIWRADSFEKTLMLGKIEGRRRRGQQRMRWLDGIIDSMDMGLGDYGNWWWTGRPSVLQSVGSQTVRHDGATELNWTELKNWLIVKDWCWERLMAGEEGNDRGWDGWMASLTRWTCFEQGLGVGDRQGSLVCCSPWGHKESDMTEGLNWTECFLIIVWWW